MDQEERYEQELDLSQLMRILINRWYLILIAVIVIGGLATGFAATRDDYYEARTTYAIQIEAGDGSTITDAVRLVNTYVRFSTSEVVIDNLVETLNAHPDTTRTYTPRALRTMISVRESGSQSIAIDIVVTSSDPVEAALVANELFNSIDYLVENEMQNLQSIDSWGMAKVPEYPSGPNRMLYSVVGVLLGGMVGVLGVFLIEFFDKTIKSTTDIEKKLQLRVLGIIPDYNMDEEVSEE